MWLGASLGRGQEMVHVDAEAGMFDVGRGA